MTILYQYPPTPAQAAPVGGATEAEQQIQSGLLQQIADNTDPGTAAGLAKETKQDSQITLATALNAKDFSTAAKQDIGNTSLGSIDTKLSSQATAAKQDIGNASLSSLDGKVPATIGQKANAASLAVTLSTEQQTLLQSLNDRLTSVISSANSSIIPLTGAATFTGTFFECFTYGTMSVLALADQVGTLFVEYSHDGVTVVDSDTLSIPVSNGKVFTFGTMTRYMRVRYVNGASAQATFVLQTIFHANYIKPSSHIANDVIGDTDDCELIKAVITGRTAAGAYVNIAANTDGSLFVGSVAADVTASGNITTQNLVPAGAATANSAVEIPLNGHGTVSVQVTGTYTGALSAQATIDGTTWITLSGLQIATTGLMAATIVSASTGIFQFEVGGFNKVRITGLAAMTGTAVISLRATRATSSVNIDSALPAGSNTIGAVTVASTTLSGTTNAVNSTRATVAGTVAAAQITVGTAAVRCTVAGTAPSAIRKRLSIKPNINNSGRIFIGPSTVTTANGLEIVGPDRLDFEFDSGDYYMISDTAAQVVEVLEKA